jgi:hypothetical protein
MSFYSLVHQGSQGQNITTAIFVCVLATNFANVNETLLGSCSIILHGYLLFKSDQCLSLLQAFSQQHCNVNILQFTHFLHLARDHYYVYLGHYVPLQMLLKGGENFGHP